MAYTKEITLWCDEPDCHEWTVASGNLGKVSAVRRVAAKQGWVFRNGRDFCSKHGGKHG